MAFCRQVREGYLDLAHREPERVRVIDSSGDVEETWRQVEATLGDIAAAEAS